MISVVVVVISVVVVVVSVVVVVNVIVIVVVIVVNLYVRSDQIKKPLFLNPGKTSIGQTKTSSEPVFWRENVTGDQEKRILTGLFMSWHLSPGSVALLM